MSIQASSFNTQAIKDFFSINPIAAVASAGLFAVSTSSAVAAISAVSLTSKAALACLSVISGTYSDAFLGVHLFGVSLKKLANAKDRNYSPSPNLLNDRTSKAVDQGPSPNTQTVKDFFSINPIAAVASAGLFAVSAGSAVAATSAVSLTGKAALACLSVISGTYSEAFLGVHLLSVGVKKLTDVKNRTC